MKATSAALAWLSGSALGVALAVSVGVAPAAHAYANPARDEARAMMRRGDFNDALTKLSEAVGLNPDDPDNYLLRGKCFFHMKNFELAIQDFNKVLQFSPNYYQAFLWRGTAHARLGNDDLAIKDYEQAIRLRPQLASRYFGEPQDVQLPGTRGSAGGPVADYKEAMRRVYPSGFDPSAAPREGSPDPADVPDFTDPMQVGTRFEMEPVLEDSGRRVAGQAAPFAPPPKAAGRGPYRALAINPVADTGTGVQGNLDVGRSDETLDPRKNRRVVPRLDVDPDFGEFGAVAGSQPLRADPQKIIDQTTEALRQENTNAEYFYLRAKAYQALAKVDNAYADYCEAIRLNPDKPKYYIGRASLFYQLNKPMLVDADIKRALSIDQSLPRQITFGYQPYPPDIKWSGDGPGGN